MSRRPKLRVLLIVLEHLIWWRRARHVSYCIQLGFEEGLEANDVEYFTLTTPWLAHAPEICAGMHFDQVWIDVIQSYLGETIFQDERLLEWLAHVAPVRVGLVPETLQFPLEEKVRSHLRRRWRVVENQLSYLTHVVACDEADVARINAQGTPALWWPQAVPERLIDNTVLPPQKPYAIFGGAVYGERLSLLHHPQLQGLLVRLPPPEAAVLRPFQFEMLHFFSLLASHFQSARRRQILSRYLAELRRIRRQAFGQWIAGLKTGCAVVNLPHRVKTYAGRVVEGMAAGRPVISWEIPDRPHNRMLFEPEREILLFSPENPLQLAEHIRRLQREPELARQLVQRGQAKVKEFHTLEKRVRHILHWLETGDQPTYGAAEALRIAAGSVSNAEGRPPEL